MRLTARRFFDLLRRRPAAPARFDAKIEKACARDAAVLVCDCSHFTKNVHDRGLLHVLSELTKRYHAAKPLLRKQGGRVALSGADNLIVVFPDAAAAARAAVDVQRLAAKMNRSAKPDRQIRLCMGIHGGRILLLEDDIYGDAVNVASKLGEDLASADEILVTGQVAGGLGLETTYARGATVGGMHFELHRVVYR